MIIIREIAEDDSIRFLNMNKQLDQETTFMLLEPQERTTTIEQQKNIISGFINTQNSNIFVAEINNELVGHLTVIGGNANRIRHRAHIVIGILNNFIGQGIGRKLFEQLEQWRPTTSLSRLELTVMVHNERALALYKRMGFEIEGIKKRSIKIDDQYVDEYYMGKTYT